MSYVSYACLPTGSPEEFPPPPPKPVGFQNLGPVQVAGFAPNIRRGLCGPKSSTEQFHCLDPASHAWHQALLSSNQERLLASHDPPPPKPNNAEKPEAHGRVVSLPPRRLCRSRRLGQAICRMGVSQNEKPSGFVWFP